MPKYRGKTYNNMNNNSKKRIAFITGTRADFGKLKSLIAILNESDLFDIHIFATGMHMLANYGYTVDEILKCGFPNIHTYINHTTQTPLQNILASTLTGFGNFIQLIKPDMVVVHGDRIEALAGALVGSFNNILVAHIEGGEVSGTIDEHIRHSVSKMSHLHFVANEEAKKRLIQLGEDINNIFVIGSPDLDIMNSESLPSIAEAKARYNIPFEKYALCIYHAVTSEIDTLYAQTNNVVGAILESGLNYVIIYPNNDPGTDIIRNIYNQKIFNNNKYKIFPSIRFEHFLTLLKNSQCIVGNSSAGIREAPYYGIPTINIGTRQNNRVNNENCKSIFNCGYEKNEILQCIKKVVENNLRFEKTKIFGDGSSHQKFYNIIRDESIWKRKIQKQFLDINFNL